MLKSYIKKILPKDWLKFYHKSLALAASFVYGKPSEKMIVIGVTGTNGKSTTVNLIAELISKSGFLVGATSTIGFRIGEDFVENTKKMSMLGRFKLQKLLSQMKKKGCTHVIVETTSEGIEQYRHLGINYDICVFTNLTPEHIESHGGFENYKKAKGKLFDHLSKMPHKTIGGVKIEKVSIVNIDDEHADYFLSYKADIKIGYGIKGNQNLQNQPDIIYKAEDIIYDSKTVFRFGGIKFEMNLLGEFNIYNAMAALVSAHNQGIGYDRLSKALSDIPGIPGRMETIENKHGFKVIVDYAHEPAGLETVLKVVQKINHNKIIHILGSCGGGRDTGRRKIMGNLSAKYADIVIVTNEDPYDDDPVEIINAVAKGARDNGKKDNEDLIIIEARRDAIKKAFEIANPNDIVIMTGKGSEPVMAVGKALIPWDDRKVSRELLSELKK